MRPGLDQLAHVVVLMMENRSFDHMLGSLKADDPRIEATGDSEGQHVAITITSSLLGGSARPSLR
jgi:phospholipase C